MSKDLTKFEGKIVTVFGGFSEVPKTQSEDVSKLGSFLGNQDHEVLFLVGGALGYLKLFINDIPEKDSRVFLIGTTQGKEIGFHLKYQDETPSLFFDGYFGKKKALFDHKVTSFLILPDSGSSLGAFTELIEAIDQIKSFDLIVNQTPRPIVFYGKYWQSFVENIIYPRINDSTRSYINFVDEGDYHTVAKMLKLK